MSLSEIIIKIIGLILAFVGLALILSAIGLNMWGISLFFPWNIIVGVVLLGAGIYIVRGGNIGL